MAWETTGLAERGKRNGYTYDFNLKCAYNEISEILTCKPE